MSPIVGLWLIMGLAIGLLILRRAAVARRKQRLQRQAARLRKPRPPRTTSERGEMRAYEDPSTLARDITTTGPSNKEPSSGEKR